MNNNYPLTNEEYKKLLHIAKDLEKQHMEENHDAQRACDYHAGLTKMLDIIFFAEYKKESK